MSKTSPKVDRPEDLGGRLAALCEEADIDAIMPLHEPEAVVRLDSQAAPIRGLEQIRQSFTEMLSKPVKMNNEVLLALEAGGIALTMSRWRMEVPDGDQSSVREGVGIEVLRQQPDGSWKLIIDNPLGLDGLA